MGARVAQLPTALPQASHACCNTEPCMTPHPCAGGAVPAEQPGAGQASTTLSAAHVLAPLIFPAACEQAPALQSLSLYGNQLYHFPAEILQARRRCCAWVVAGVASCCRRSSKR